MKNMTKLGLIALIALSFIGCNEPQTKAEAIHQNQNHNSINVYCDVETGVEYLRFSGYKAGGLTLRVNADGTPKTCSQVR